MNSSTTAKPARYTISITLSETGRRNTASIAVEQKMAAIERWNRQQVENADAHRQQRNQLHQPLKTERRRPAGHVGDLDWAAELAFVLAADRETLHELAGALDDMAGFAHRLDDRAARADS